MGELKKRQEYEKYLREVKLTADYIMALTESNIRPPIWEVPEKELFKALFIRFALNGNEKDSVLEQTKIYLNKASKEDIMEWMCSLNSKHPSAEYIAEPMNNSFNLDGIMKELIARINLFSQSNAYQKLMTINYTSMDSIFKPEEVPHMLLKQYFG